MKTLIAATAMLMLLAINPATAADCPYDDAQKEEIRAALGIILCVLDERTALLVLKTERLKTKAQDMHPTDSAKRWEYFYNNIDKVTR